MMKFKYYVWEEEKKYRNLLLLAILIILIISIFEALKNNNYFLLGSLKKLNNDDVRYINTAKILLEKHQLYYYNVRTCFIMPLFPLFLSGIMWIFGTGDGGLTAIRITQCIMQGISLYFVYLIAREIFNKRIAIITAFLFALYLPEIVAPNLILTEVLFQFLFIPMFYFSLIAIKENKLIYYIITSVLWALACLTRPNAAVFPLFIIIFWLINKYKWRDIIKYMFIAATIFIIFFAGWWIRNYNLKGKFILFTDSSANPKLLGALIFNQPPSFANEIPTKYGMIKFENNIYTSNTQQTELANYIIKKGFETNFLKYLAWYTVGKTFMLYMLPYYWKSILHINYVIMLIIQVIYIILSILGIINLIKKKDRNGIMLLVLLAITTVVYWPFFACSRYAFPSMFIILILVAYEINSILIKKYG